MTTGAIGPLVVSVTVTVPDMLALPLVAGVPKGGNWLRLASPVSTSATVSMCWPG